MRQVPGEARGLIFFFIIITLPFYVFFKFMYGAEVSELAHSCKLIRFMLVLIDIKKCLKKCPPALILT